MYVSKINYMNSLFQIKFCKNSKKLTPVWRALLEMSFIMFLFYSNLLMGEYTNSGIGEGKGLLWAIKDIFTATNFLIAFVMSLVGYVFFEFFRKRL